MRNLERGMLYQVWGSLMIDSVSRYNDIIGIGFTVIGAIALIQGLYYLTLALIETFKPTRQNHSPYD
jgi:hypothetical protein